MDLPILSVLRRKEELETARLEDDVINVLTDITDKMAMHGGTAVWRCYNGKRFSTDIDVYIWDESFKEKFIGRAGKIVVEV